MKLCAMTPRSGLEWCFRPQWPHHQKSQLGDPVIHIRTPPGPLVGSLCSPDPARWVPVPSPPPCLSQVPSCTLPQTRTPACPTPPPWCQSPSPFPSPLNSGTANPSWSWWWHAVCRQSWPTHWPEPHEHVPLPPKPLHGNRDLGLSL